MIWHSKKLQTHLQNTTDFQRNIYIGLAVFLLYFCAYGFRKLFAASTFKMPLVLPFLGEVNYKLFLMIFQILGYMSAKFMGIRWIAEVRKEPLFLGKAIIFLLTCAVCSWIIFAWLPPPYTLFVIFINGFPL